jgi:hypothetical protein
MHANRRAGKQTCTQADMQAHRHKTFTVHANKYNYTVYKYLKHAFRQTKKDGPRGSQTDKADEILPTAIYRHTCRQTGRRTDTHADGDTNSFKYIFVCIIYMQTER